MRCTCVHARLVGSFNVSNALPRPRRPRCSPGFELDAIVAGLERPTTVPGRMERVDAGQDFTVLVDYAHTPDALESVLDAARGFAAPGGAGDRGVRLRRRPRPRQAARDGRDRGRRRRRRVRDHRQPAFGGSGGDRGRRAWPACPTATAPLVVELDRRAAIRAAVRDARPGDVVVVAGKGHETGSDRDRGDGAVRRPGRRPRRAGSA